MAKALSRDLRDRVVAAIDGGLSRRGAAARFGVSVSSGTSLRGSIGARLPGSLVVTSVHRRRTFTPSRSWRCWSDLPPSDPAVITRVCRFDIRAALPAQARRA
jgi:hypothetical protein